MQAKFNELIGLEKKLSTALQLVGGLTTTRLTTRSVLWLELVENPSYNLRHITATIYPLDIVTILLCSFVCLYRLSGHGTPGADTGAEHVDVVRKRVAEMYP